MDSLRSLKTPSGLLENPLRMLGKSISTQKTPCGPSALIDVRKVTLRLIRIQEHNRVPIALLGFP